MAETEPTLEEVAHAVRLLAIAVEALTKGVRELEARVDTVVERLALEALPEGAEAISMEQAILRAMFDLGAFGARSPECMEPQSDVTREDVRARIEYWITEGFLEPRKPPASGFVVPPNAREFFDGLLARAQQARLEAKTDREKATDLPMVRCPDCNGRGADVGHVDDGAPNPPTCPTCGGFGIVPREEGP